MIEAATHIAVLGEFFGLFRRTMMGLIPQIGRTLHLPPAQNDLARDVIYGALKQLAEADAL
jgi:hypothetical protein